MSCSQIYFDHGATTAVRPEVIAKMLPYFGLSYGNPSSVYNLARSAKHAINGARETIAQCINAKADEIYFTGCGSESDNWALKGILSANKNKGNHIITSAIEHHAIITTCEYLEKQGYEVTYVPVDENGVVNPEDIEKAITDKTVLISVMFANNEIGTIEPIKEIGEIARKHNVYFHTDAVQAVGHIPVDVEEMNIDLLSMSAHKFNGPKGIGALYVKKGVKIDNLIHGGGQEKSRRAGTENVPSIVGMAEALRLACAEMEEHNKRLTELRDKLISEIQRTIPYVKLNGHPTNRLPGNVNFSFNFIEGESLLLSLDLKGICASTGSACASGSLDPSHVLLGIGLSHEVAHGSLRITLGYENENHEVNYLLQELPKIVEKLRMMSPLYEKVLNENK